MRMPPENVHRCGGRKMPASLSGGRDAERVQQPVVVVRRAVLAVHRDVELVGALDQIEAVDGEADLAVAAHRARRRALDVGVGAVAADAVGVEDADAEDEVGHRLARAHLQPNLDRVAGL